MSHYRGNSHRQSGDSYRPHSTYNHAPNTAGYGQGRSGDRGSNTRSDASGRMFQQGTGRHDYPATDSRTQRGFNKYPSHGTNESNMGFHKPQFDQGGPRFDRTSNRNGNMGHMNAYQHGHTGHNNHGNYSSQKQSYGNTNYNQRQPGNGAHYGNNNYRNSPGPNHQDGHSNNYQQRRPANTYHQAYSQTQAESQLWMGDLDPNWTETDIMGIWGDLGEAPTSVKIIRDKSGKPQYSFVTFGNQDAVASALQKNRSQIPGSSRFFKLNWASGSSHNDHRTPVTRPRNGPEPGRGHSDFSLFVGDLSAEVSEPEIFDRFNREFPGEVRQVKIMLDPNTNLSKGFGFVRFITPEAQQKALKSMNGVVIGDRPIRLGLANGSSQESSTPISKKVNDSLNAAVHIAQYQPPLTPFTDPNNTVITIKGIIPAITRDELVAHFLPFGNMVYCKLDYVNQIARVKYLLRGSAERAILYMHGLVINGACLVLRWGRDETGPGGSLKASGGKGESYKAAEKPPTVYGELPSNVVFEDLSREEAEKLDFTSVFQNQSVEAINLLSEQKLKARQEYLNSAF